MKHYHHIGIYQYAMASYKHLSVSKSQVEIQYPSFIIVIFIYIGSS